MRFAVQLAVVKVFKIRNETKGKWCTRNSDTIIFPRLTQGNGSTKSVQQNNITCRSTSIAAHNF